MRGQNQSQAAPAAAGSYGPATGAGVHSATAGMQEMHLGNGPPTQTGAGYSKASRGCCGVVPAAGGSHPASLHGAFGYVRDSHSMQPSRSREPSRLPTFTMATLTPGPR